jgi:hypothetical protein
MFVLPLAVHVLLTPIERADRDKVVNIVARIRANEHRELRPAFAPQQNIRAPQPASPQLGGP